MKVKDRFLIPTGARLYSRNVVLGAPGKDPPWFRSGQALEPIVARYWYTTGRTKNRPTLVIFMYNDPTGSTKVSAVAKEDL